MTTQFVQPTAQPRDLTVSAATTLCACNVYMGGFELRGKQEI